MIKIIFSLLIGISFATEDKTKQSEQWVQDWKEIRKVSFQNRKKACEQFQKLSWLSQFPHQDLIEFKKSEYCKTPPRLDRNNFASLMESARYHREEFNYGESLRLLNRAIRKAALKAQRIDALEEQLKVYRIMQNKEQRLATLKKLTLLDSEKFAVEYARTLWTYNKIKKAQGELRKADKKWKKDVSRQGIYYIQGRILEEQKKPDQAFEYYQKALAQPDVDLDITSQLLSSVAWWQFKKGDFAKSAELWKQLAEKSNERFTQTRALYWQAQSLFKLEKDKEAKPLLESIIQEDPLSYYTVLAHRDLKKTFKPVEVFKGPARELSKISWVKDEDADKFSWALKFDEKVFADTILNSYTDKFHKASEKDQRIMMENYWQAGLTNSMIRLISNSDPDDRLEYFEDHQNLLFPSKYEDQIQKISEEEKLDPSFVLSLIRQESGFNPMARSPTDALGLMQLMPKVARAVAKEKGLKFKEESELFDPDLNIKLGVRELKNRLSEFGNNPILAAASYNAGSDAVKGWIKSRFRENTVEFIEEIPYEETRTYVRLILRNQIYYKRLLEKNPFSFPEAALPPIKPLKK